MADNKNIGSSQIHSIPQEGTATEEAEGIHSIPQEGTATENEGLIKLKYLNKTVNIINSKVNAIEQKINSIDDKIKENEREIQNRIQESKNKVTETLAIFVSLFTFASISFGYMKNLESKLVIGLILIVGSFFLLFPLLLHLYIGSESDIQKPENYKTILFYVAAFVSMIVGIALLLKQ